MYPVLLYEVWKRREVKRSESRYIGLRGIRTWAPPDTTSSITPSLVPSFREHQSNHTSHPAHQESHKHISYVKRKVGRRSVSVIRSDGLYWLEARHLSVSRQDQ